MGNQATVIIRLDALDDIKRNAQQFADNLYSVLCHQVPKEGVDIPAGNHANPARIVESHHCDNTAVILAGGATAYSAGLLWNEWRFTPELIQKAIQLLEKEKANAV